MDHNSQLHRHTGNGVPRELAIPGMHQRIFPIVRKHCPPSADRPVRALDLGAGQGAFTQRLRDAGYAMEACDLYPELFRCPGITCRRVDAHEPLPYPDDSFELVVCLEVLEHLESQLSLFREVARVLKPHGTFIFSTPNVASIKSRLRFLFTGYLYAHGPLDPAEYDPVSQHISPFSPDRYRFVLARAGMQMTAVETDKYQRSSLALAWLTPLIRWRAKRSHGHSLGVDMQNCAASLFGRAMVGVARKGIRSTDPLRASVRHATVRSRWSLARAR